ncbi:hypothetical protein MYSE111917_15800 [Mycobacterium senriense]
MNRPYPKLISINTQIADTVFNLFRSFVSISYRDDKLSMRLELF